MNSSGPIFCGTLHYLREGLWKIKIGRRKKNPGKSFKFEIKFAKIQK